MRKVYWIDGEMLGGRPGPMREPWSLKEFAQNGITTVVSLTERMLNRSHEFKAYGLCHYCIPLPKNAPPREGDLDNVRLLVPFIGAVVNDFLEAGNKIIIHCSSGKDRSALVLIYFLVRFRQYRVGEAYAFVRSRNPKMLTANGWGLLADEFFRSMGYSESETGASS